MAATRELDAGYRARSFAEQAGETGDAIAALGLASCAWQTSPPSVAAMDVMAQGLDHVSRQLRVLRNSVGSR
ncbi:MAG: hypothetical protein ABI843_15965 [Dokdonella sp.]